MKNISYLSLKAINAPYEKAIAEALIKVVDSGWYLRGRCVSMFENEWASYCDAGYCVGCGNGLDALRLVLMAWKNARLLEQGDEVIVPANTFIATVLAVSESGLTPVLTDPDPDTGLLTVSAIKEMVSSRTRVILPVHLYGQLCDMESIMSYASAHSLLVLEDCAQCHGINHIMSRSAVKIPAGHHACAWSFYPGKNLGALGDAGAVTTDSKSLADEVRALSNYGSAEKYVNDVKGLNSRMDELQAAVLSLKLADLNRCNGRRIDIAHRYLDEVVNPKIMLPHISTASVFHIFPVRCDQRDELQAFLDSRGIQTQIHYPIPPHKQQAYPEWHGCRLPVTEAIARTELSLPCNQAMTDDEVTRVIEALNDF